MVILDEVFLCCFLPLELQRFYQNADSKRENMRFRFKQFGYYEYLQKYLTWNIQCTVIMGIAVQRGVS